MKVKTRELATTCLQNEDKQNAKARTGIRNAGAKRY